MNLPLAKTRNQKIFWERLSPVNRVATTDTYKRTMSVAGELFAKNFACYTLAARKLLDEEGANGRLVMSGLEKVLYPWFMNPISEEEIKEAKDFFTKKARVKAFAPNWDQVLENDGYMPIDIYSLAGGQTFLAKDGKYVPIMSIEGPGAFVSHLEPHLTSIFEPIIQATKARLMRQETGPKFAEFGLRGDPNKNNHVALMMDLYVGGRFSLTSDDQAVFLFPEYFQDIGTIGHEYIMAYIQGGISLEEAQRRACKEFVNAHERSALLPDIIDTIYSGLPMILQFMKEHPEKIIMPRLDSGDIPKQAIMWRTMRESVPRQTDDLVVEDGYTPSKTRATKQAYEDQGGNSDDFVVGAGGYFKHGTHRDAISMVYKRSATQHGEVLEAGIKFSNSEGKESIPGKVRVYEQGETLIVAQAEEELHESLMQKVLDKGRIVYNEDLDVQARRTEETWNKYSRIAYSPKTQAIIDQRTVERNAVIARVRGGN